ncbi:ribosome recycling factor [Candidatus Pantoea edessiphila]|uniref:Ribosome-recycling factor n=1 Tax=Candidatus Pantoea edessiphila TaxID=2044610 RepID=A0A2P5SWD2_9GAMM|nr:ribosome recycling factor [Candidatus Pantoea edessiphila]PPI86623.1 ribosome recycling factor [Candidatus Pantoea edessiphila]
MTNEIIKDIEVRMNKCIELFKKNINKIRTGRASTTLLDNIKVKYYDTIIPISQLATITVENSRTLKINVFDFSIVSLIENTIKNSELGLNPFTDGKVIYVPIPVLNEERRKELIKVIRNTAEQSRISIRNIRRETKDKLKVMSKEKKITEDQEYYTQELIQKITHSCIVRIDDFLINKENELMKF